MIELLLLLYSVVDQYNTHYFDYVSISLFHSSMKQAIKYFMNVVFTRFDSLVSLRYNQQELLLFIDISIQSIFLKFKTALYSEYFYNNQRKHLNTEQPMFTLFDYFKIISIECLIPYLVDKLDFYFNEIKFQIKNNIQVSKPKTTFKQCYPYFYCLVNLLNTAFQFKYLLDPKFKTFDLRFYLLKMHLIEIQQDQTNSLQQPQPQTKSKLVQLIQKYWIVFGYFLFKLLEQHYQSDIQNQSQNQADSRSQNISNRTIKPPSNPIIKHYQKDICGLCKQSIRNPAVLQISGYVFCFLCIEKYIEKNQKCPITSFKTNRDQIIRIFSQT